MAQLIAIYDMDKTITRRATWTRFLRHATRGSWRSMLWPLAGLAGMAYGAKLIDRAQLKQMTQRLLLGGSVSAQRSATVAAAFAERELATGILEGARTQIAADKAAGYRLVMATASYGFYARVIATQLGFDDVIATGSVLGDSQAITARIDGENCYGPAKLRAIEAWLDREGVVRADAHVRFYSDHVSDAPALAWADEPFAVNAHAPLASLAKAKGWPQLDWR